MKLSIIDRSYNRWVEERQHALNFNKNAQARSFFQMTNSHVGPLRCEGKPPILLIPGPYRLAFVRTSDPSAIFMNKVHRAIVLLLLIKF